MMELEQAIKILSRDTSLDAVNELKYYAGFCSDIVIEQIQEAMDMGAEALKKQIPKKVGWTTDHTWGIPSQQPICPVCDYYVTMTHFIGEGKKITHKLPYP